MSERTLSVSDRMAEEIQQWASDELGMWPRDTAYAADLESLLAQLDAEQPAPDAVAEATRDIADFPEDGTWAVLYPGYYGPFTACWADGAWRLCEEADLRQATRWTPLDIAALTKESRP